MTVKEQYKREYRNYLRRVNRAVKQGYIVDVIARVKKPTKAAINRLKQQTGEKIRSKSRIVDVETGEILKPIKNKKKRLKQQRKNVTILKADLPTVDIVVEGGSGTPVDLGLGVELDVGFEPDDDFVIFHFDTSWRRITGRTERQASSRVACSNA